MSIKKYPRSNNTNLLHPSLLSKVFGTLTTARNEGLDIHIFETWRSCDRQSYLLLNERSKAAPMHSWHQYGLAVDLVFGGPGLWNWNGDFKTLGDIGEHYGLEWGGRFKSIVDSCHFQLTNKLEINDAYMLHVANGLLSVWDKI